jgi:uncharacterized membrane protein required for colicin V production
MWTWHGYNVVDGLVVLFLGAGLLGGIRRGFSGELVRALIAVAAAAAAVLYARPVSEWAMLHANLSVRAALIGAFIVVFFGAYLAVTFVRVMLGKLADFRFKGPLERIGGALCGLARAAGVSGLILLLLGLAPNDNLKRLVVDESVAGRFVTQHLRPLYGQLVRTRAGNPGGGTTPFEVYRVPLRAAGRGRRNQPHGRGRIRAARATACPANLQLP